MYIYYFDFPGGSDGKVSAYNAGDLGSIPGSGKISWRRKWHPTPVLLPENPMDRGAWQATVHGVAKSRTRLSDFTFTLIYYFTVYYMLLDSVLGKRLYTSSAVNQ